MRRWQAISVAAIVAAAAALTSFGTVPNVGAGTPTVSFSIDCDLSTGGIQSGGAACSFPSTTTTLTVGVILSTTGPFTLGTFDHVILASPNTGFLPPASGSGLDANPNFTADTTDLGDWSCGSPAPDNDVPESPVDDPTTSRSLLSCFNGSGTGPNVATTLQVSTVTYTVSADGVFVLSFDPDGGNVFDETFSPLLNCAAGDTCNSATIQIGTSAATATPTTVPTNTPPPAATPTPCSGASCPTPTSLAFDTVTPTGTPTVPATATPVGGAQPTVAPGGSPPPGGGAPGGSTGGGGTGPIRLPDTGSAGTGQTADNSIIMLAAAAAASVFLAGSLWFSAATVRRREED